MWPSHLSCRYPLVSTPTLPQQSEAEEDNRTPLPKQAPLRVAAAPPHLRLPWSQHSADSGN
ncbi:unnamed protein product [Staurois parvus]|uniref:Uncharacterized protein n=1 Tax=Staurois parvus TaxID=386267 RepID=A0ABN9D5W0_9NEOB|nr:unnamed protein product [Staurois parvus]